MCSTCSIVTYSSSRSFPRPRTRLGILEDADQALSIVRRRVLAQALTPPLDERLRQGVTGPQPVDAVRDRLDRARIDQDAGVADLFTDAPDVRRQDRAT